MKRVILGATLIGLAALGAIAGSVEYNRDGKMVLPKDYRQWVFLTAGIGMNYNPGPAQVANPPFENVFVNREAYDSFAKTGTWPDGTMLILEVRGSDSKVSINKDGRVQTDIQAIEAHVKDGSHGGWAFYAFGTGQEGTLLPKTANCYSCHQQNGAVDTTFVQFYPTLQDIAKAKGTFKAAAAETKSKP